MCKGKTQTESIAIGQATIQFKLNTGADANIIPYKALTTLAKHEKQWAIKIQLHSTNSTLVDIGDGKIRPKGVFHLDCMVARRWRGPTSIIAFYVLNQGFPKEGSGAHGVSPKRVAGRSAPL